MKKAIHSLVAISVALVSSGAFASVAPTEIPGRLPTRLSAAELAREKVDETKYPHFMAYLRSVDIKSGIHPSDPRNAALIKTENVFTPNQKMWDGFFKAAAEDHLTCLRAFALLGREIKKYGVVVFGPGADFENAVRDQHVDLGLALPAHNIGTAIWTPDPKIADEGFLLHLKIFYTEPFVHQFPDDILPANLKVGYGDEATYWMNGQKFTQHTVDTDIYYSEEKGVGFRNVKGIGGQKRGVMGFFQKVLFFLPDAVSSMTIDEAKNTMVTEALVNTTVDRFETESKYSIKIGK